MTYSVSAKHELLLQPSGLNLDFEKLRLYQILVTAKDDTRDVVVGLDSGADDYPTKPVDHAALTARVRSILRTKALHDTVEEQKTQLAGTGRSSAASPSSWRRSNELAGSSASFRHR